MSSHRSRSGPSAGPAGSPDEPGSGAPGPRRTGVLAATAILVLALDLISKALVVAKLMHRPPVKLPGDFIWLVHARNPGAAFSFAEGATVVFTAVAVIVIVVIVRTASKLRSTAWAISLGLVLGGAAGNLVDRLFRSPAPLRGWVVDWISLRSPDGRMLFPIFNLADSGIVCGGILAVLLALLGVEMDGTRGDKEQPATAEPGATPPPADPADPAPPGATGHPPAAAPTAAPIPGPIPGPTAAPTAAPIPGPTAGRTAAPTGGPTPGPTPEPMPGPTGGPTAASTAAPTAAPIPGPTAGPASAPTAAPIPGPTAGPARPTAAPNGAPEADASGGGRPARWRPAPEGGRGGG